MSGYNPPVHRRGDPIRAADRNAMNDQLRRLGSVRGGPGLVVRQGAGGLQTASLRDEEIYLRLTSSANGDGGYSWVEVYPSVGGAWTVSTRTGDESVDPAYDRFGAAVLTAGDRVYVARRAPTSGAWIFKGQTFCTLNFILTRTSNCGAVGATVDFVETVSGVTVWSTTITSTTGGVAFPFAVAGRAYTINYTYFSISGSASTTGCSGVSRSIANPPESGLPNSCYEPMPPVLYVTDDWGTHQVWPTPECFNSPIVGNPYQYTQRLLPTGGCNAPGFSLTYQNWTTGTGCTIPGAGIIAGASPFLRNCSRPFLYSGTYPTSPPFGPSHPLPGRPFLVHE